MSQQKQHVSGSVVDGGAVATERGRGRYRRWIRQTVGIVNSSGRSGTRNRKRPSPRSNESDLSVEPPMSSGTTTENDAHNHHHHHHRRHHHHHHHHHKASDARNAVYRPTSSIHHHRLHHHHRHRQPPPKDDDNAGGVETPERNVITQKLKEIDSLRSKIIELQRALSSNSDYANGVPIDQALAHHQEQHEGLNSCLSCLICCSSKEDEPAPDDGDGDDDDDNDAAYEKKPKHTPVIVDLFATNPDMPFDQASTEVNCNTRRTVSPTHFMIAPTPRKGCKRSKTKKAHDGITNNNTIVIPDKYGRVSSKEEINVLFDRLNAQSNEIREIKGALEECLQLLRSKESRGANVVPSRHRQQMDDLLNMNAFMPAAHQTFSKVFSNFVSEQEYVQFMRPGGGRTQVFPCQCDPAKHDCAKRSVMSAQQSDNKVAQEEMDHGTVMAVSPMKSKESKSLSKRPIGDHKKSPRGSAQSAQMSKRPSCCVLDEQVRVKQKRSAGCCSSCKSKPRKPREKSSKEKCKECCKPKKPPKEKKPRKPKKKCCAKSASKHSGGGSKKGGTDSKACPCPRSKSPKQKSSVGDASDTTRPTTDATMSETTHEGGATTTDDHAEDPAPPPPPPTTTDEGGETTAEPYHPSAGSIPAEPPCKMKCHQPKKKREAKGKKKPSKPASTTDATDNDGDTGAGDTDAVTSGMESDAPAQGQAKGAKGKKKPPKAASTTDATDNDGDTDAATSGMDSDAPAQQHSSTDYSGIDKVLCSCKDPEPSSATAPTSSTAKSTPKRRNAFMRCLLCMFCRDLFA